MDFDWQAQWENGSDEEFELYARMTDEQLIKALKKNFGKGRNEDYKMVKKVAFELWGKKNMLET